MDTKLVKSAGEHWVASVLSGLGWAAALTRDGLERTDVLAVHATKRTMVEIQVKAASHSAHPSWRINRKAQRPAISCREWFVLVALAVDPWAAHRAFVIPRDHVGAAAWIRHQDWLTEPGVPAGKRNASVDQARIQDWAVTAYENRWDLLEEPSDVVPVLLPADFRTLAKSGRVGLPPDHPCNRSLPTW